MSSSLTLYNLSNEMIDLINLLDDEDSYDENGELDPVIQERFDIVSKDFNEKAISYSWVTQMYDNELDAIDKEIQRLMKLKDTKKRAKKHVENFLASTMVRLKINEVKTDTRTLKLNNYPVVDIVDRSKIPTDYQKPKIDIEINKAKIKEDLKKGIVVEGARLVDNYHIRIK